MSTTAEGDRWLDLKQERWQRRKREKKKRAERIRKRMARRAQNIGATPQIKMQISKWETDEFGNYSRQIYSE